MANTLDLLTLAEARREVGMTGSDDDTGLAAYVTSISLRLDALVGAIVQRNFTETRSDVSGKYRFSPRLINCPVASITSIVEYTTGGTSTTLTAETASSKPTNAFRLDSVTNLIERRTAGTCYWFGSGDVVVTGVAGRFADTASVDERFKLAARIYLSGIWRQQQGTGAAGFGDGGIPAAFLPGERAALTLLNDEIPVLV